jgi:16S rRNA (adenine1518-N6/adenine1519-N6)-dimethyltransferase
VSRPKKRFGQHFLHDPGTIERIVRTIAPAPGQRIVEIGPGRGAITRALLERAGALDVIEIHHADALTVDLAALRGTGPRLRLVGNLPYNISTPLLFRLIGELDAIEDMHFMLQKELVARMAAAPGRGEYGRLTVMLAPHVRVRPLFDIRAGAFSPPPKVVSTFFALEPLREPPFPLPDRDGYARVVAAAFAKRRKTLRNSLAGLLDVDAIRAAGVDPGARPETLAPERFAALADQLPSSARG